MNPGKKGIDRARASFPTDLWQCELRDHDFIHIAARTPVLKSFRKINRLVRLHLISSSNGNERMKKYIWLFSVALLINILLPPAAVVADIFQEYEKVIWINQLWQTGAAYAKGKKVRMLTGDAETTTEPGAFIWCKSNRRTIIRGNIRPPCVLHIFQLYPIGPRNTEVSTVTATKNKICHPWLYPRERARN